MQRLLTAVVDLSTFPLSRRFQRQPAVPGGSIFRLPVLQLVTNAELSNIKRQLKVQEGAWARVQWGLAVAIQPHEVEVVQGRLIVADPKASSWCLICVSMGLGEQQNVIAHRDTA